MIAIREARELDVEAIREIFLAAYGSNYAYPEFYDLQMLKRMVFDEDTLLLVAEDTGSGRILGTASIMFDIGAFGDLVGEFGRLVVHPDGRRRGIGRALMQGRLERVEGRLHVGIVDNRTVHPFSQRISSRHGFVAAGFLPQKLLFRKRECLAMYVRHFGDALQLRRSHPRVIPEACLLAQLVLANCGMVPDAVADDESQAYPECGGFVFEELTTHGYAALLRFERARGKRREVFGAARLLQGLFKLRASHSHYLIAREKGQLVGAVGYTIDELEKAARIFEIVTMDERPTRQLLREVTRRCRSEQGIEYIEADVSAYSPRMQRTFLELHYLPVAYIPALAFQDAERCDAIRMARLFVPLDILDVELSTQTQPVAELVVRNFATRRLLPRIVEALPNIALFAGLGDEQAARLASLCSLEKFASGTSLLCPGNSGGKAFLLLSGEVAVTAGAGDRAVGVVRVGECLGESALLTAGPHVVSARATCATEAAVIDRDELAQLIRRRPDIGVVLYRNLAEGLGAKLRRLDADLAK